MGGSLRWRVAALGLAWLFGAGPARADGAFPDASRILLPPDQPRAITLATNFGLISTADDGATWTWSCETALVNGGRAYQLAADRQGMQRRIVALSSWGLVRSDDDGCTWAGSDGAGKDDTFSDVFVLPTAPATVWALGIDPGQPTAVFASNDGAATLTGPLFQAQDGEDLLGVEPAATDPATAYLTLASGPDTPSLAVTHDGGAHWQTTALAAAVGSGYLRILAVDAATADTVYLRQSTTTGDRLLITRDGGHTWEVALSVSASLAAFLQRSDGTLLVGLLDPDGKARGVRSSDAGRSFLPWAGVPHLRALAERDGVLFAAADDTQDGFALGSSVDGGKTFTPRLRYTQVSAVASCVRADCRVACQRLADLGLWPSGLCLDPDAGAAADGGSPADAVASPDATRGGPPPHHGCAIAGTGLSGGEGWAALLVGVFVLRGRGRGRGRRGRRQGRA